MQVSCARCQQRTTLPLPSGTDWHSTVQCSKCAQEVGVDVRAHLVHAHSNTLAHLVPDNCVPVDLLPACYGAQCGGCGMVAALRDVQVCSP